VLKIGVFALSGICDDLISSWTLDLKKEIESTQHELIENNKKIIFFKKFGKAFLEAGGLEAILSFLKDEKFLEKHLKSFMKTLGRVKERVLKLIIADISALSQVVDDNLFLKKSQETNLIEFTFNLIKTNEFTSDFLFSANLFLLKICNDHQSENGFDAILVQIEEYLKKCADDFTNKDLSSLMHEIRDLKIDKEIFHNKFYALDVDNCGIMTTLNVILESLILLGSKNTKNKNFKTIIYDRFKSSSLDVILEKGNSGEKKLVLDIYEQLAFDADNKQKMDLSDQIKDSILENPDYEKILKHAYTNLFEHIGKNWATPKSKSHDFHKESTSSRIKGGCFC
jgi:hypothetical protein